MEECCNVAFLLGQLRQGIFALLRRLYGVYEHYSTTSPSRGYPGVGCVARGEDGFFQEGVMVDFSIFLLQGAYVQFSSREREKMLRSLLRSQRRLLQSRSAISSGNVGPWSFGRYRGEQGVYSNRGLSTLVGGHHDRGQGEYVLFHYGRYYLRFVDIARNLGVSRVHANFLSRSRGFFRYLVHYLRVRVARQFWGLSYQSSVRYYMSSSSAAYLFDHVLRVPSHGASGFFR